VTLREGLHRPAWSCGECRRYWFEWRARNGYASGMVRGPGDFERWADRLDWVLHDRSDGAGLGGGGRAGLDRGRWGGTPGQGVYGRRS